MLRSLTCLACSLFLSGCVADLATSRTPESSEVMLHFSFLRRGTYDHDTGTINLKGEDKSISGGATLLGLGVGTALAGPGGGIAGGLVGLVQDLFGGGREYESAVVGKAAEAISGEGSAVVIPDVTGSGGLIPPAPPSP